jgi:hypothetical protein
MLTLINNHRCGAGNHNLRRLSPPLSHGWILEPSAQEAKEETTAPTASTDGNKKRQLSPPLSHGWILEPSAQEAKEETTAPTASTDGNKKRQR